MVKEYLEKDIQLNENKEIMLVISSRLNQIMDARNVDTRDLVNATGLSTTLVNMLKRGEGNPSVVNILKISRFFGVPISYFLDVSFNSDEEGDIKKINIYDLEAEKFVYGNELYSMALGREQYSSADFGVRVGNSSMEPIFSSGTVFIISSALKPESGDSILMRVNKKTLLRKMINFDGQMFFSSLDIKSENEQFKNFSVIGVVVGIISGKY